MFKIPTLKDLMEQARQAFRAYLKGSDAYIWPNNVYASAKVMAGLGFEIFGFANYIQRQKFALTADGENLDLHGNELGLARRPATPARGYVAITVDEGALSVELGAIFRRTDAVLYRAIAPASRGTPGILQVEVIGATDGKAGIAIAGTPLEIVSGVIGEGLAEVAANGITGGTDVEDDEDFRARILFRKRNPPHGGAAADYVMWAKEVSGVSRVFVERVWAGAGTVRVFPIMDDLYSDGIAPSPQIARVTDHISAVQPAGAIVTVVAPTAKVVDITIENLVPDTTAQREAVMAALRETFQRMSVVAGSDASNGSMDYLAIPASFSRSWIWQAVANATGEQRHSITAPADDVPLSSGEMATLGVVTFE